jgi:hypothetical protein
MPEGKVSGMQLDVANLIGYSKQHLISETKGI